VGRTIVPVEKGTFAVPVKYVQHRARWQVGPTLKNYALKHPDNAELSRNDFAVECCYFFSGFDCEYYWRTYIRVSSCDSPRLGGPFRVLAAFKWTCAIVRER
jgi:hypothetical protein